MADWQSFFLASSGASAGLTGLIFISISINISKILNTRSLIDRGLICIILLMITLIISLLHLIPGQSNIVFGTEMLTAGFASWILVTMKDLDIYRTKELKFKKYYIANMAFDQIALIPYIAAGFLALT